MTSEELKSSIKQFKEWAKNADTESIDGFSSLDVFDYPHQALLFILLRIKPDFDAKEMQSQYGISEDLAMWIICHSAAAIITVGSDQPKT